MNDDDEDDGADEEDDEDEEEEDEDDEVCDERYTFISALKLSVELWKCFIPYKINLFDGLWQGLLLTRVHVEWNQTPKDGCCSVINDFFS